jgi:hypothetical protein
MAEIDTTMIGVSAASFMEHLTDYFQDEDPHAIEPRIVDVMVIAKVVTGGDGIKTMGREFPFMRSQDPSRMNQMGLLSGALEQIKAMYYYDSDEDDDDQGEPIE